MEYINKEPGWGGVLGVGCHHREEFKGERDSLRRRLAESLATECKQC